MDAIDIHVHVRGVATVSEVERFLSEAELSGALLFSRWAKSADDERRAIEELAELHARLPDRVYPFALLDPTREKATERLEWAVHSCGMVGLKMLPSNFRPEDACARALYTVCSQLHIPLLMHTGILWAKGYNANNCRPANMEVLSEYPEVRFAMAHIGWPWTDECIAVAQKLLHTQRELEQAFVDTTPGTPPSYRESALAKCIENVHADFMLYGSDATVGAPTTPPQAYTCRWRADKEIYDRLKVSTADQEKIFSGSARRFLLGKKLPKGAADGRH